MHPPWHKGTDNQYVSSFPYFYVTHIKQQHTCGTVQCLFTVYEAVGFAESGIFSFNTRQYTQVLHKQHQAHTGNILEKTAGNWHKCFGRYSAQLLSSYNSVDNRLHMSSLQKVPTNCTQQLLQVQLLVH